MKLVINLITRNRPEILARTIETTLSNITLPDTVLMVSVDNDDEATKQKLRWYNAPQVKIDIRPREDTTGAKYNRALEDKDAGIIVNLSDYNAFTVKGFDEKIVEAASLFPDGYGLVVNHLRNASFPDTFAMTRKLADKLGYYAPPLFTYWFWDHWVFELCQRIDRVFVADTRVEYDKQGKPPTMGLRELGWWTTFFDCAYLHRRMVADAIVDSEEFEEASWRKKQIKAMVPHIEYRSKWINDSVRQQARDLEWQASQGGIIKQDDRYMRAKGQATALVPGLIAGMPPEEQQAWAARLLPPANVVNIQRVGVR